MQNIVAIGGDHQVMDRQAHPVRQIARIDIAEIAGRHGEVNGPIRAAHSKGSIKVVNDLGHDACPVDGINRDE